jgi:hypothetical protein
MRVILADSEGDVAARTAIKDQHRTGDWLHRLPEQQPVAGPVGIGAQRAEQRLVGQYHADTGLHEVAKPRVFRRIAQAATVALQPVHQLGPVAGLQYQLVDREGLRFKADILYA